jgi:hypothetical protein
LGAGVDSVLAGSAGLLGVEDSAGLDEPAPDDFRESVT